MAMMPSMMVSAQNVTYIHDTTKQGQFTMQETGAGSFSGNSEWYYDIIHNSYKRTITATNKNLYRAAAYQGSYEQVSYADSIKERLEARAKVEALNIADRQIDLAWLTEQSKIENAMTKYRNNLSLLAMYGASSDERDDWAMYTKMWDFEIDRTRKAYMANSERQKEFLCIYDDIVKRNMQLIKRTRYLKALKGSQETLQASTRPPSRLSQCVTESYNRWRQGAWKVKTTAKK